MNSVVAILVLMGAACFASKTCKYSFQVYDFFNAYMTVMEDFLREGKCSNDFQPFPVDFQYKGKSYLLLVNNGTISNAPNISLGYTDWCGHCAHISISSTQHFKNLEYTYQAYLISKYDHNCESTECSITASNKHISTQWYSEKVKNYNGSGIYTYPRLNYTVVLAASGTKDLGQWEITASCPGSGRRLERKIERAINDVGLVLQRNILRDTLRPCLPDILPEVEIADYFTKNCFFKC